MIIPEIKGDIRVKDFFIFSSCDSKYFDSYAKPLYNSIKINTSNSLHLHVINPTDEQLKYCEGRFSFSYEFVDDREFLAAADRWNTVPSEDSPDRFKYDRIIGAMRTSDDKNISDRVKKTYFACVRFIRLAEIIRNDHASCFSMDVDAIVRQQIPELDIDTDVAIHYVQGKQKKHPTIKSSAKDRFLAGGVYIKNSTESRAFLNRYADLLLEHINRDEIYWSLDQEMLKVAMSGVSYTQLPSTLIDFEMGPGGIVWTAKGQRKDLKVFQDELSKYNFS
jgi:hypothetical protein